MESGSVGYGPFGSSWHEGFWGVTMPVVYHTPQGLHPAQYNETLFLARYYRDEAGWHTWTNFTNNIT